MATPAPVKVGFIGTGGIARGGHLGHLSKWPDVQLAAFCDVNREAVDRTVRDFGGRAYTDAKRMLEHEELDAVYVCVPPFAHTDQELLVAEHGRALFVEKPLATTLEKAREIKEAVAKAKIVSAVGYNWRATAITQKAKEIIAGKPISAAYGYWIGGMPGVSWWRQQARSGGQLVEQTTHVVDIARHLIGGAVTRVYAAGVKGIAAARVEQHDIHDNSIALLSFDTGTVCAIGSGHLSPQGFRTGLDLILDGLSLSHNNSELRVRHPGGEEVFKNTDKPYEKEDRAFIEAVKAGNPEGVYCSYADAFETHRITMAANQSMASGEVVTL